MSVLRCLLGNYYTVSITRIGAADLLGTLAVLQIFHSVTLPRYPFIRRMTENSSHKMLFLGLILQSYSATLTKWLHGLDLAFKSFNCISVTGCVYFALNGNQRAELSKITELC